MSFFAFINDLFNKWAEEGEKNIRNLNPQPVGFIEN